MEVFKNILPEIYEYFKEYKPGNTLLTIDDNNNVNLVDNGQLVYDGDPKKLAIEQLDAYAIDPKCFSYGLAFTDNKIFEHEKVLKKFVDRKKRDTEHISNLQIETPFNEPQLDFFSMIGCGLGYQIEELFNRKNIKVFFLHEPSPDVFFAAMHCIDFKPLIDKCKSLGGSFTISVGANEFTFVNQMNSLLKKNGFYLVSRMFVDRHYFSDENFNTFKLMHDIVHRLSAGWGFFEDEIISLIHTLENTENSFPILTENDNRNNVIKDLSVVIVGNGPSLDNDIKLLKSRQGKVLIVSCGTALKSLLNNGIVPNLQVEMERTAALDNHYELFTAEEHNILKTIPIVALNTVYSGLLNRFSQAYTMLKVNDAGTDLTCFLSSNKNFQVVKYCNPTVSNAGLMAMLHLGFENINLLGVDLGFVDEKQHHSKSSMYYKGEWDEKERINDFFKPSKTTEGNFREEVSTINILDSSKGVMEFAIKDFHDVNIYNCSDGAKIVGATPLKFDELKIEEHHHELSREFKKLLDNSFEHSSKDKAYVHNFLDKEFFPKFRIVIDEFKAFLDEPINSRKELSDVFSKQNDYVYLLSSRANTMLYFRFLKGSMIYFQATIMSCCAAYTDENMRMSFIRDALEEMKSHFEFIFNELLQSYDKPSKL